VASSRTVNGHPLLANDPHLSLGELSTFYPIGLKAPGMDVEGEGFAGVPGVIIGHNRWISWGATTNPMDVTDT
jgi:penicillin amidase